MSKKALNQYGEDFILEDKEEINLSKAEKIKKDSSWIVDTEENVFEEDVYEQASNESHGFKEAVIYLENLINTTMSNDYIKADYDSWTIVFTAYDTLVSRDTLGAYEKGKLQDWWILRIDKQIQDPEIPEVVINPMNLYYEYKEEEKEKTKKLGNK